MIQLFQPSLGKEELAAVAAVFESHWIGKGSVTERFEYAWAGRLDVPPIRLITTNSATAALFSIARHCGWGPGDEVILPSISFVGAANAIVATGAKVIFADVDTESLNITQSSLIDALNSKTKAVILLNYGGVPCSDLGAIQTLCNERNVKLIIDNACSPFSEFHGIPTGLWGDFGIWSFDAMKLLSSGDGGLIYAKSEEDAAALRRSVNLGISKESGLSGQQKSEWWNFDVESISDRSISNDIASAIGLEQLKKVDSFLKRRKEIDTLYTQALGSIPGIQVRPPDKEGCKNSHYMYWIQLENRNRLAEYLLEKGVYSTFRYFPLHKIKIYGFDGVLPGAESAAKRTLNIPLHQGLADQEIEYIVKSISNWASS